MCVCVWLCTTMMHRTVLTMFPLILQTLSLLRCCSAEVCAHDSWTFNHSHITLQWLPAKVETKVTVTKQFIRVPDSQSLTKHDNTCTGTLSKCAATVTKDIRRKETMFTVNISLRPLTFYRDDSNYYCEVKTHTTQRFVSPTTGSIKETQHWYEL